MNVTNILIEISILLLSVTVALPPINDRIVKRAPFLKGIFSYKKSAIFLVVVFGTSLYYKVETLTSKPNNSATNEIVAKKDPPSPDTTKKANTGDPRSLTDFQSREGYRNAFLSCPKQGSDYQPFLEIHSVPDKPGLKWYAVRAIFLNKAGKVAPSPMVFWNRFMVNENSEIIRSDSFDAAGEIAGKFDFDLFDRLRNDAKVLKNEYKNRFPVLDSVGIFNYKIYVDIKRDSLELYWDRGINFTPPPETPDAYRTWTKCELTSDPTLSAKITNDAKQLLDDVSSSLSVLDAELKSKRNNRKL